MSPLIPVSLGEFSNPPNPEVNSDDSKRSPSKPQMVTENNSFLLVDNENKIAKIWLFGDIGGGPTKYIKTIATIQALTEEWELHYFIHSPGGCIVTTCHILSALVNCKALVVTHNLGLAASCGSLLLSVGKKIHVYPHSTTMFHSAAQGLMDLVHRVASRVDHTTRFVEKLFDLMKSKGLITETEYEAITKRGEEFYITGTEMEKRLRENNIWYDGGVR